ncbi:hypothetical protein [Klebsiella quasipneumoniae]|uniref:hypothetical protein n=1 Tax=Klebsiella quasipneumoniae TaxID=1463165 RepID=UPI0029BD49A4|nr:hypothetical protein [Salmonella enterica]
MITSKNIKKSTMELAFEFFYWFSRFEFCLKENKFLESENEGSKAKPGWDKFVNKFSPQYTQSNNAKRFVSLKPLQQKVGKNSSVVWDDINLANDNELQQVVRTLKTIRNNLFHGGKHSVKGWDDINRTEELLVMGVQVMKEIVQMVGWDDDFERIY